MEIRLRAVTLSDTNLIIKWRNSDKVRNHCFTKEKITEESHLNFYKRNVETGKYKQFIVERLESDFGVASYPIATVYLKDLDYDNKRCELCIFASDDVDWNCEGQTTAIKLLLKIAFDDLGLHKIYSYVFSKYVEEVELLRNAGFSIEAILKDEAIGVSGSYEDVIRMSVLNELN